MSNKKCAKEFILHLLFDVMFILIRRNGFRFWE